MPVRAWAHRGFEALRQRYPDLACRARNTLELAPWYLSRMRARRERTEAYDARFWDFHDTGDWAGFARVVLELFPSSSIVDIGCGHGSALSALAALGPDLTLRGFDESPTSIARARAKGVSVDPLDIVALSRADARAFADSLAGVDLAICLEVAEHMPAWHSNKLLDILTCGSRVIFSAAHVNQGGTLHVNERPAAYWADRIVARGYRVSPLDGALRTAVASLALAPWYAENVHAFERAA